MTEIVVKFGADTADFSAELAIAQRQMQLAANEMKKFATEIVRGGSGADSARAAIASWSSEMNAARARVKELSSGLREAGEAEGFNRIQQLESMHVATALTDSLAAGINPLRALAMEGGRIGEIFAMGGAGGAMQKFGAMIGVTSLASAGAAAGLIGLAGAAAYLAIQWAQMNSAIENVKLSAAVNQVAMTNAQIRGLIDSISKAAEVSTGDAATIAKSFLTIGEGGAEIAKISSFYLPMLAQEMGGTAIEAADKLAAMFRDLSGAGLKYVSETKGMTAATIESYKAFVAAGQSGEAYRLITDAMVSRLEAHRAALVKKNAEQRADIEATALASSTIGGLANATEFAQSAIDGEIAAVDRNIASLRGLQNQLGATTNAQLQFVNALATAAKFDAVKTQIDQTKGSIEQMRAAMATAMQSGDATGFESLRSGVERAQQQMLELQQKAADGLLGRDAVAKTTASIKQIDDAWKGSSAGRVQAEIDAINKTIAAGGLSAKQQESLAEQLSAKQKELREAEYSDFTARESLKVTQAGENKTKIIALRQEEYQAAVKTYGAESQQAIQAMQAVEQARQSAAKSAKPKSTAAFDNRTAGNEKQAELSENAAQVEAVRALAAERTISFEQERSQLLALAAARAEIEKKYINDASSAASQKMRIEADLAKNIQKINDDANKEIAKSYRQSLDGVRATIDGAVMGIATRTETLRSVARSVATDIVKSFFDAGLKMAENWILQTGIMAAATAALNALTGGLGGGVASIIGAVLPGHAAGSWELPSDHIAMVHKGEMIIPAGPAAAIRNGQMGIGAGAAGGGGGDNHFHYHAERGTSLDTMRQHSRELAKMVGQEFRNNPSLRPSY